MLTRGVELLSLQTGTKLHFGEAVVEVTGLREPCAQLNKLQPGLMKFGLLPWPPRWCHLYFDCQHLRCSLVRVSSLWRWTFVPAWAVQACVVLTPGILEPSFFFADNLVAASLTTLALAMVSADRASGPWIGIGGIVVYAMLVKVDAVLIIPAILFVLWQASREYKKIVMAALMAIAGATIVFH